MEKLSYRVSWIRLAVFASGVVASAAVYFFGDVRFFWLPLLLSLFPFGLLVRYHRRFEESIAENRRQDAAYR